MKQNHSMVQLQHTTTYSFECSFAWHVQVDRKPVPIVEEPTLVRTAGEPNDQNLHMRKDLTWQLQRQTCSCLIKMNAHEQHVCHIASCFPSKMRVLRVGLHQAGRIWKPFLVSRMDMAEEVPEVSIDVCKKSKLNWGKEKSLKSWQHKPNILH